MYQEMPSGVSMRFGGIVNSIVDDVLLLVIEESGQIEGA